MIRSLVMAAVVALAAGCVVVDDDDAADAGAGGDGGECALPSGRYALVWRLVSGESDVGCGPVSDGQLDTDDDPCTEGCRCASLDEVVDGACARTIERRCQGADGVSQRLDCTLPHDGDGTPFGGECVITTLDRAQRPTLRCVYDVTASRARS